MRNYKRKTKRAITPQNVIKNAVDAVLLEGKSIRKTAKDFNIPEKSLSRYCKKQQRHSQQISGYIKSRQVFTDLQEGLLEQYVTKASDIYYGLSPKEVRKLAYQYGKANSIKMPHNWSANEAAGEDWFSAYLKRHKKLSIRKPEATSQARVSSFNPTNVQKFYNNLQTILNRLKLENGDIWNMDETGITTVQTPDHIVARKGFKQIGRVTSAERGNLVTVAVAVSASGNSIPPFFIFPRVKFKSYFLNGAPDGSAGAANPSGWMTEVQFLQFSHHFVKYARSRKERPVLLLLDNHDSHLSVEALDYFKENGVSVCSFPPHCSHKLQPLDRSVFGPFKKYTNTACDAWMTMHPGSTMSVYSLPGIVGNSFPLACTPNNIKAGFAKTGIYPLNVYIFGEHDFMPAYTTDRPPPKQDCAVESTVLNISNVMDVDFTISENDMLNAGCSKDIKPRQDISYSSSNDEHSASTESTVVLSPEDLRPLKKAEPRKRVRANKRSRTTSILTDSPNMNVLKIEKESAKKKKLTIEERKQAKKLNEDNIKMSKRSNSKGSLHLMEKSLNCPNSSVVEECFCLVCVGMFSKSKAGEVWVQCTQCHLWAHESCIIGKSLFFICNNCC
nr:uncharacterized protein LOC124811672 isoform X1 [Hydra vulgaris]